MFQNLLLFSRLGKKNEISLVGNEIFSPSLSPSLIRKIIMAAADLAATGDLITPVFTRWQRRIMICVRVKGAIGNRMNQQIFMKGHAPGKLLLMPWQNVLRIDKSVLHILSSDDALRQTSELHRITPRCSGLRSPLIYREEYIIPGK